MKTRFGQVTKDKKTQKLGTRVGVFFDPSEHGWAGRYFVSTHGKSPDEAAAEIARVSEHHRKKCARLDDFSLFWNNTFVELGATFIITDWTIRERGTDVEVFVNVRMVRDGKREPIHNKAGYRLVYPSIDAIESNEAILLAVRAWARKHIEEAQANAAYQERVNELLGGGG